MAQSLSTASTPSISTKCPHCLSTEDFIGAEMCEVFEAENQGKCPHCLGTVAFMGAEYCDVWAAHCRQGLAFFGIKGTFRGVPIPDYPD
jgi:hypothetical protein